ncbi:hypothetical protein Nepgr_027322 [Nepenthes gracilis]|uniref:Pentatricopeptide repeat-containing protein n=1 Tax=Nepenthes gracilis TaxID=150966 RepID=A0AAD3TA50_NEPGR|nr:hypothetical protein Nepgr_027322 [Nepenthes gracilis]
MIFSVRPRDVRHLTNFHQNAIWIRTAFRSFCQSHLLQEAKIEIDKITRIINDHPFPDTPLYPTLLCHIPSHTLSSAFVENVLGSLFVAHTNGLKAYEFYKFSLQFSHVHPTSDAFEKTLHILTRMRYFDKAWELMEEIAKRNPSLLTLKAMSIMLSRIAKFQTYEATLKAFEKMEKHIFVGRKFGTNEFNVLLRAFCTQRQMKEAKSIFKKMHARFPPNSRTMNILLLGFKETSNLSAVELFYHEMVRRRFKPNAVTYNIRIDAYCKKGSFGDGLRLFQEMERVNCLPTLETITTLIHGAGLARNTTRAWQLFNEISARNLCPDIAAYNALISSLVKCGEVQSAILLMDEMEDEHIGHDGMTYHTLFYGLMRSGGIEGVCDLYDRMTNKHFVPKTQTVVMLMKFFCQSCRLDLGLNLWEYVVGRGFCPHDHALALLVTGLCSHGRTEEAFECSKQMLSRGRNVSSAVFQMLERFLLQAGEEEKLRVLDDMTKRLQRVNPPSPH